MTEENRSYGFTAPFVTPEPETHTDNTTENTDAMSRMLEAGQQERYAQIDAMATHQVIGIECSLEESSGIFDRYLSKRQGGELKMSYDIDSKTLTVSKKK